MVFSFLQRKCHPPTRCIKKIASQPCYNVNFLFEKDSKSCSKIPPLMYKICPQYVCDVWEANSVFFSTKKMPPSYKVH